ncbi:hypothetical protein E0H39_07165 [Rhizobium leguminosarum bv. viciae]|uniref:hypothetical protein n=1 Tax=Rhizobium leguminosarum TaxID=384 RepID=UPI00103E72A8|nr:hypothetical protein [Rhizobium leguminosarum]TBY65770.1 hypothetical protein E0H39_07165 [Rhizobium leguminosarum bv. viciae]
MRKLIFLIALSALSAVRLAYAQTPCDEGTSWRGLNLREEVCENWAPGAIPQSGEYYAALDFRFVLANKPVGAPTSTFLNALKNLIVKNDEKEIALSVVAQLGDFAVKEQPIYRYNADLTQNTFGVSGDFEFSTPYIRFDNDPISFTLKARTSNKVSYDVKAALEKMNPVLNVTSAGGWVVSEAAKPALDAVADVTDNILNSYYNSAQSTNAVFRFGEKSADGVVKRVMVLKSDNGDDVGTLSVSVKFRRSMVAGLAYKAQELTGSQPSPDYTGGGSTLGMELPAIGSQKNTLFASLAADDNLRALLSRVAYSADPLKPTDCSQLRAAIRNNFGFNDIDTLRTIYELLEVGDRQSAYTKGSRACFTSADWVKLVAYKIIPNQNALPDQQRIEFFATGLRQGFKENSIYEKQLADLVQVSDETGENLLQDCAGFAVERARVLPCLNTFKLNRYEITASDKLPITIATTRREQVLQALKEIPHEATVIPIAATASLDLTSVADARAAAKLTKHIYRFLLRYDEGQNVSQIVLQKADIASVGSELTERLSLPCWVNASSQSQSCGNLPADQR